MVSQQKRHGQTYTPQSVSRFLTGWAIQSSDTRVLEPSVGEGRFVLDTFHRLQELGATADQAAESIHGMDIDEEAVATLQEQTKTDHGLRFPNISANNLFDTELADVDTVIGNPPYVIRHRFADPDAIINKYTDKYGFSDQADLYCYFIVRALEALEPGGRFAMIVSNSWMKKRYGEEFKRFLLKQLDIHALIGFEKRVFSDRLINNVCILAEKKPNTIHVPDPESTTTFIQTRSPATFDDLATAGSLDELRDEAAQVASVPQPSLNPKDYWDIWLRAPDVFEALKNNSNFAPLEKFATPMIGVQTLAKDFYVLTENDIAQANIEQKFLKPFAYSPRNHQEPVLKRDDCTHRLFWCADEKADLTGTNALTYITNAEQRTVEKRYSDETYDGLHNKTRIKDANRSPWYNLTDEAENRLPAQILLPRRVYENYMVGWNNSQVIPNENFLATTVPDESHVKPLLAYLNSSLGELCLRLAGQVYGGGVCDLNVSSAKQIRTIDLESLTAAEHDQLEAAFEQFVHTGDRQQLDKAVYDAVAFDKQRRQEIEDALEVAVEESLSKNGSKSD